MNNVMTIQGVDAVIQFDPDLGLFRGEFTGLNGGADFYAADVDGLQREGEVSLRVFLEMCAQDGVEPFVKSSGRLMLRLPPELHAKAATAAKAAGISLNSMIEQAIRHELAA